MATDPPVAEASAEDRVVQAGLRRFDRLFNIIIGVFGMLFALQTSDSLAADAPTMSGLLGTSVIVLVLLSVLVGLGPVVLREHARNAFLTGIGLYAAALLIWPLSITAPIPTDPMPWLVAVWPVPAAYAAQVGTSRVATIGAAALLSVYTGVALQFRGGLDPADSAVNSLFMTGIAVVLVLLLGAVRRGIIASGQAQQAALAGFAVSRSDEATEAERKRTDALLHDAVLTTFLSAAAARDDEADRLSRRMASNALRVLMHVHGVDRQEAVMPFGQAIAEQQTRLTPLRSRFEIRLDTSESIMLPEDVARAIVAVLLEAAESSVEHARDAQRRTLSVEPLGPDGIRAVVEDDGCGLVPSSSAAPGRGSAAVERLRAHEGRVDVRTAPENGTTVTVSWGSVVMVGTTPLPAEEDLQLAEDRTAR